MSAGFTRWTASGAAAPDGPLAQAVTFWAVFHVVKAVLAIMLLVASLVAGHRVWTAAMQAGTPPARRAWITAGMVGAWLPVLALVVVLANVQGAVAPLSSVLTFLPVGTTAGVDQVRAELATGAYGPVTGALVADFCTYHAVLAVCLAVVVAGLVAYAVRMLVRRAQLPHDAGSLRRIVASGAAAIVLLTVTFGLVLLANLSTVVDPAPALAAFLGSGAS